MDVKRIVKFRNKTWSKFLCKTFQVLWRAKSGLQGDGDGNILYSEIKAGSVSHISISTMEVSKDETDSISEELSESDEMDSVSEETIFISAPVRRSFSCPSQLPFLSTMAEERDVSTGVWPITMQFSSLYLYPYLIAVAVVVVVVVFIMIIKLVESRTSCAGRKKFRLLCEELDSDEDFLPDRTDKHWDWDYTSGDESINEGDIIPSRNNPHWDIGYTSGDESYRDIRDFLPPSDVNLLDWESSEDEELYEAISVLEDLHEPTPTEEQATGGLTQDDDDDDGGSV